MPQPLAALPAETEEAAPHAGQVSDHRVAEGVTEDVAVLVEQLKAAVDSIPTYIERCAEMVVLTPSVKHADREGDCCDFNSWRREQQPVDRSVPLRPRRNPPLSASSCPSSMLTALGANGSISLSLPPSLPLSTVCVQSAAGAASSSCRPGSRAAAISL
jgi:hypothetical protein